MSHKRDLAEVKDLVERMMWYSDGQLHNAQGVQEEIALAFVGLEKAVKTLEMKYPLPELVQAFGWMRLDDGTEIDLNGKEMDITGPDVADHFAKVSALPELLKGRKVVTICPDDPHSAFTSEEEDEVCCVFQFNENEPYDQFTCDRSKDVNQLFRLGM